MTRLVVTIDGPAASGKSTVACLLAQRTNAAFLDTGAMYRAVTLAAMKAGADLTSKQRLLDILNETRFEFASSQNGMLAYMDGVDVTDRIRGPEVTANARYIAACAPARKRLVEMQRRFAEKYDKIITEGRDQGTVAFPDADVKFFLTADLDERARRRQADLAAVGVRQSLDQIRRDRSVGPLKPAEDAVIVDTTYLTIEQVVEKLLEHVRQKCSLIP
jgi:cytidylate kinase